MSHPLETMRLSNDRILNASIDRIRPSGTAFGVHEARGAETTRVEEPANVLENVIM